MTLTTPARRPVSRLFIALLAAGLPLAAAFGQQPAEPTKAAKAEALFQKRFAAADANGDGKLTKQESEGKMPYVFKHFDEIDSDHKGYVTKDQIQSYFAQQHAAHAMDNK